ESIASYRSSSVTSLIQTAYARFESIWLWSGCVCTARLPDRFRLFEIAPDHRLPARVDLARERVVDRALNLEHDSAHVSRILEHVAQQLPHGFRHRMVVEVVIPTVDPLTARDVDLEHAVERDRPQIGPRIVSLLFEVERVRVNVVQVDQQMGVRFAHQLRHEL